jgi:hypothetical protein
MTLWTEATVAAEPVVAVATTENPAARRGYLIRLADCDRMVAFTDYKLTATASVGRRALDPGLAADGA